MKVSVFITSSAILILFWLGVTFFLPVPMETYGKSGPSITVIKTTPEATGEIDALTNAD